MDRFSGSDNDITEPLVEDLGTAGTVRGRPVTSSPRWRAQEVEDALLAGLGEADVGAKSRVRGCGAVRPR